ncbi:MAG: sodium-dependent transporter [Cyclobacteriaceae bacterium]|nr:sodium-dependent transporter [Cyclobacteriaceae bacterium]MCH8515967.1 sodium-dependent transporter [Cyclobacteriaceae bacterium]
MSKVETFSNRWGIILASLGMAIGAGNLWRFPKMAGQYGGAFIVLWIFFLLVWSIPILLSEFSIGKKHKKGVIGSYGSMAGKKYTWLGYFITLCTLGIAFYYSVVTGWALRYFLLAVENLYLGISGSPTLSDTLADEPKFLDQFWMSTSNGSFLTVGLHVLAVVVAGYLLSKGIQNGLEKINKILIPTLFLLLIFIAIHSVSMENGLVGLNYIFEIDFNHFKDYRIWLEALTQSAWSTGAGWGLMMTVASYSRDKEDVTLNTLISAFGNNTASLVAAFAILPSVFAMAPSVAEAEEFLKTGSQALTFTVIPQLFSSINGGYFLTMIFFTAFTVAAFTSLLPMVEMFIKNLMDLNIKRRTAGIIATACCVGFGLPSAWSLNFFNNQDWVWGVGLVLTGFIITIAVVKHGPIKFKKEYIDVDSDFTVSNWYFKICTYINLFLGLFLVFWLMYDNDAPWLNDDGAWNFFSIYSNASVVTQWAIVIVSGLLLNNLLYKYFVKQKAA